MSAFYYISIAWIYSVTVIQIYNTVLHDQQIGTL